MSVEEQRAAREKELEAAFKQSSEWVSAHRGADPLGGFSRGGEWGAYVLANFMPAWFVKWHEKANWHPAGVAGNLSEWWSWVQAFGLQKEDWWRRVEEANKE